MGNANTEMISIEVVYTVVLFRNTVHMMTKRTCAAFAGSELQRRLHRAVVVFTLNSLPSL